MFGFHGLPSYKRERQRARNFVIEDGISFDSLIEIFECDNLGMYPTWEREQAWKNCWPESSDYKDMLHWWTNWNRLAKRVDTITELQKLQQFDCIMLQYCEVFLQNILRLEVTGQRFDLTSRWNYIYTELKCSCQVQSIKDAHQRMDPSPSETCSSSTKSEKDCYSRSRPYSHGTVNSLQGSSLHSPGYIPAGTTPKGYFNHPASYDDGKGKTFSKFQIPKKFSANSLMGKTEIFSHKYEKHDLLQQAKEKSCWHCGGVDHRVRHCPSYPEQSTRSGTRPLGSANKRKKAWEGDESFREESD